MDSSSARSQVIPANEYRRVRWQNGAGWTREILRSPDDDNWDWRLSIAEVEQDGPFSTFSGIERELVLLDGQGMRLCFDDGHVELVEPPHGRVRFDGDRTLRAELVDGPTHDFNLMWRRGRVRADLWHRPLVGPMVIFAAPTSTWAVYMLSGQARFTDGSGLPPLAAGDCALFVAGGRRLRHVLEGGGETLVIRIESAATSA